MPWVLRPPLGTARGGLDSVDVDGVIYAIGGFGDNFQPIHDSVEVRDPVSEAWAFIDAMSMVRGNPGAASVDGRIYVVGGFFRDPNNTTSRGESFDPPTKTWTRIRNRRRGPVQAPGATAVNGLVYIIGGEEPAGVTDSVSIYDPATDRWSPPNAARPMPTARTLLRAVELGGQIYAVGGRVDANDPFSKALERYDPSRDTWIILRPMSTGRGDPGVVVAANGRIFAVGGATLVSGSPTPLRSVEEYDPQTDVWTPSEPLPVARASLVAERGQGNTILAIGGFEPGRVASTRVESLQI